MNDSECVVGQLVRPAARGVPPSSSLVPRAKAIRMTVLGKLNSDEDVQLWKHVRLTLSIGSRAAHGNINITGTQDHSRAIVNGAKKGY